MIFPPLALFSATVGSTATAGNTAIATLVAVHVVWALAVLGPEHLASGSHDNTVKVWDVAMPNDILDMLCVLMYETRYTSSTTDYIEIPTYILIYDYVRADHGLEAAHSRC